MGRKKGSLNANRENMSNCSLTIRISQEQMRYLRSKRRYSEFVRKLIQGRLPRHHRLSQEYENYRILHREPYRHTCFDIRTNLGRVILKFVDCTYGASHEHQLEYICDALEGADTLEDADITVWNKAGIYVETVEERDFEKLVSRAMYESRYDCMV